MLNGPEASITSIIWMGLIAEGGYSGTADKWLSRILADNWQ